jgi:hypothetical protein
VHIDPRELQVLREADDAVVVDFSRREKLVVILRSEISGRSREVNVGRGRPLKGIDTIRGTSGTAARLSDPVF